MKKTTQLCGAATLALTLLVGAGAATQAQDSPEAAIKHRQTTMKSLAEHLGAVGKFAKGETSDADEAAAHAAEVAKIAVMLPDLFPAGTGPDSGIKTRATAAIWGDAAGFQKIVDIGITESAKLAEVAQSGDPAAIGAQIGVLGKNACGACHTGYRSR